MKSMRLERSLSLGWQPAKHSLVIRFVVVAGRAHLARPHRSGCLPLEPPQDLLHSSWRRRPWHGPHWRQEAPGRVPADPPCHSHRGAAKLQERQQGVWHHGCSTLWIFPYPANLLCLHLYDGVQGSDRGKLVTSQRCLQASHTFHWVRNLMRWQLNAERWLARATEVIFFWKCKAGVNRWWVTCAGL